ncbi:ABC transporter substrate-binding protein [Leptolyngbya sp. AN02str]|uniref:ABC transporter substrate-binding protein n=1 Tax=Leptolyngbya sp. AN02str TaxID=3423363 RepID=UPI003D311FC1
MLKPSPRLLRFLLLSVLAFGILVACNSQNATPGRPLVVGSSPWPGFAGHYVALEKGFFQAQGVEVEDSYFQIATDVNTGLLADRLDLAWTGVPDMVVMAGQDPSLRLIMLSDYSDGADGILARGISSPQDLQGQNIAWESLPLQALLLRKYLESAGLSEQDIRLQVIPAAEAASAFAANRIDVAVTYEPYLSNAAKEGQGEVIFTSKGTNIIPVGLVAKESVIQSRKDEIAAFLKAIDQGVAFVRDNPTEAHEIVARKLGVTAEEVPALLETVRIFNIAENKSIVFNANDSLNVMDSLEFAAKTSQEIGLLPTPVDASELYDASIVEGL